MSIDRSRARLNRRGFQFTPFRPAAQAGEPLSQTELPGETELLVFARGGARRALVVREMAYHHIAQGVLAGEPYLVTY